MIDGAPHYISLLAFESVDSITQFMIFSLLCQLVAALTSRSKAKRVWWKLHTIMTGRYFPHVDFFHPNNRLRGSVPVLFRGSTHTSIDYAKCRRKKRGSFVTRPTVGSRTSHFGWHVSAVIAERRSRARQTSANFSGGRYIDRPRPGVYSPVIIIIVLC